MPSQIKRRSGSSTAWSVANPVMLSGEIGYDETTGNIKIGDGTTEWNSLRYERQGATGGVGPTGPQGVGVTGHTGPTIGGTGPTGPTGVGLFSNLNLDAIDGRANKFFNTGIVQSYHDLNPILLNDGRVFVAALYGAATRRIYNWKTNSYENTPNFNAAYGAMSNAVLLSNGKVFIIGKAGAANTNIIYNPFTNEIETGPSQYADMAMGVLLPNGKVYCIGLTTNTKVLYNPVSNDFEDGPPAVASRGILMPYNGKVLLYDTYLGTKSIYNPVSNLLEDGPNVGVANQCAVVLPNGKIFMAPDYTQTKCLYNPASGLLEDIPLIADYSASGRAFCSAVLMSNGKVLMIARWYTGTSTIYDYVSNTFCPGYSGLGADNFCFGCVIMPNNKLFMANGNETALVCRIGNLQGNSFDNKHTYPSEILGATT